MGSILITIGFAASLISVIMYIAAGNGKEKFMRYGRMLFHISVITTISSAVYLSYLILTHQFQYTYVWNYSSTDLPINLLLSTFYAGQEGSFHLWAFLMAVQGIFLLSYLMKRDSEHKTLNHKQDCP